MWSLGIMLVEILTNELPYHFDNDINKLMGKVMKGDLQIPSLPSEFKPIVQGCLRKERRLRWTAQQVLDALHGSQSSFNELKSEKNIDYQPLEFLLSQGKWREADEKTADLILEGIGYRNWDDVYSDNLLNFPKTDLRTMDQLWLNYSRGKFGFSIQKKIWLECGGQVGKYDYETYSQFAKQVGWRQAGNWLRYYQINFSIDAPFAHLPCVIGSRRWKKRISLFSVIDYI